MACAYCHDFEKTSYPTRARTSLFSVMIFYFPFPINDSGENSFFFLSLFLRYNYMLGIFLLRKTRCKAILHGHAFVPFLSIALLLCHHRPWRTPRMKLASEERIDLWRDCRETYPQNTLKAAGSLGCPSLGHPQCGGAASHLTVACLPLAAGLECSRRLLATASKCPPRARDRLWHCVPNK